MVFCKQNNDWSSTRNNSTLWVCSTRPLMVVCVYNSCDFSSQKLQALYGSKTFICSFVHSKQSALMHHNCLCQWVPDLTCRFCACKTAWLASEWLVFMWSQPASVVFAFKTAPSGAELQVCMAPRPHLSFCECKTAWLSPELLVSLGYSPHLCFFFIQNSDFWNRITSLNGSQT